MCCQESRRRERRGKSVSRTWHWSPGAGVPRTTLSCMLRPLCSSESYSGASVQSVWGCGVDPQGDRDNRTLGPTLSLFRKEPEIQRGLVTCSRSHSKQWPRRNLTPQFLSPPSQDPSPYSSAPLASTSGFFCLLDPNSNYSNLSPLPAFPGFEIISEFSKENILVFLSFLLLIGRNLRALSTCLVKAADRQ